MDLVPATNGFLADSFLGKGSHGSVYRTTLDDDKLLVAIKTSNFKKPSTTSLLNHCPKCTGYTKCTSPTESGVEILYGVPNSRRIVNLIGFCMDSKLNKLIVVKYTELADGTRASGYEHLDDLIKLVGLLGTVVPFHKLRTQV